MKNLFSLIALFVGLAVFFALGAVFVSLFKQGGIITVLYVLAGASFAVGLTLAVVGFIKSKK